MIIERGYTLEDWKLYFLAYLFLLNLISYIIVWYDKKRSIKGRWRIPEKRLFFFALIGGALGIYLGMKAFRHKTLHLTFKYGIPSLIVINLAVIGIVLYRL